MDDAEIQQCWVKVAAGGLEVPSWQSYLTMEPNITLPIGAMALMGPSLVDPVAYDVSKDTLLGYTQGAKNHEVYRYVLACVLSPASDQCRHCRGKRSLCVIDRSESRFG